MKKYILLLSPILLLFWVASCRKKSNASPSPNPIITKFTGCRVSQIIEIGVDTSNRTVYSFYYNNDGTVSKINTQMGWQVSNSSDRVFVYTSNYISVKGVAYGSTPQSPEDSLILDNQNRVTYIYHNDNYNTYNNVWDNYQYDSFGNLESIIYHSNNTLSSESFSWKNGDFTWTTTGTDYYNYVYSSDLLNIGNIHSRISDMETYGRGIFTPVHVRTMAIMDENEDTSFYSYTLDSGGKLTYLKETQPGNYIQTTQISYTCE